MKQEEKSALSRRRILDAALEEFGDKSYERASLNTICGKNGISKGLLYHHFAGKDDLYLQCVAETYQAFTDFLSRETAALGKEREGDIDALLNLRFCFFEENPAYANVFFETVLRPPYHLTEQIKEIRKELSAFHLERYQKLLDNVSLRDEVSREEALSCFHVFQEMMDSYFQSRAKAAGDFKSLMADHEVALSKLLRILLYGIAKEKRDEECK